MAPLAVNRISGTTIVLSGSFEQNQFIKTRQRYTIHQSEWHLTAVSRVSVPSFLMINIQEDPRQSIGKADGDKNNRANSWPPSPFATQSENKVSRRYPLKSAHHNKIIGFIVHSHLSSSRAFCNISKSLCGWLNTASATASL